MDDGLHPGRRIGPRQFHARSATLSGGINTFTLPTVYSAGGAIVVGYIIRPWPTPFSALRYMEFTFTANSFKYNITSISFRLRRSPNGPNSIKVRTSMDGFAADLNAFVISNSSVFNTYNIPLSYNNLSGNTFSVRIYAYNSVDIYGTLWFDEISVNGDVLAIILPVDVIYLKGSPDNGRIVLDWETGWEKNSKEFMIERSSDMKTFKTIGTVAASGETTGRTPYAFVDNDPAAGINYYRLKLFDQNGTFTTSKPIAVPRIPANPEICIAPNPASSERIDILAENDPGLSPALHTASGTPIALRKENTTGGRIRLLPYTPLMSGIYFVVYVKNGRKEHLKVLVP